MLVLRLGRRRTAWESGAIDTIIKTEFTDRRDGRVELDASVYLVEASDVVRTVAEHSAGSGCDPPRGFDNINLDAGRPLEESPGTTGFKFTTDAHRELRFKDEAELRAFLLSYILPTVEQRRFVASKAEVRKYVSDRREASDPEWREFLANPDNKAWL